MGTVLLTGGTGLIGSQMIRELKQRGNDIIVLTRGPAVVDQDGVWYAHWDIDQQRIDERAVAAADYIIEEPLLLQLAAVLKVPVEAIKNFDEEAAIAYFNTFENGSINNGHFSPNFNNCTFNPLDKIVELYERMIKEKDAIIEKLTNK